MNIFSLLLIGPKASDRSLSILHVAFGSLVCGARRRPICAVDRKRKSSYDR